MMVVGFWETPPRAWGRPFCSSLWSWLFGKHPHERGEDPVAWAKGLPLDRNTPTSVGKTRHYPCHVLNSLETPPRAWGRLHSGALLSCRCWKHPHERGEDPVAWAKGLPLERNTPTSVGKTPVRALRSGVCQKHPHERGEDLAEQTARQLLAETPPRAWGRLRYSR